MLTYVELNDCLRYRVLIIMVLSIVQPVFVCVAYVSTSLYSCCVNKVDRENIVVMTKLYPNKVLVYSNLKFGSPSSCICMLTL